MNGRAECVKLFLIAGHDADRAVCVQVAGQLANLQPAGFKFSERPLEQAGVVGLEVNLALRAEDPLVFFQKSPEGQAALCIFLARPRVAEVQIEQVNFAVRKIILQFRCVDGEKKDVFQPHGERLFHGEQQSLLHLFHGDDQDIRLCRGGFHREFALAAADFQTQLLCTRQQGTPFAPKLRTVLNPDGGTGLHPRLQIVSLSHSHRATPHI